MQEKRLEEDVKREYSSENEFPKDPEHVARIFKFLKQDYIPSLVNKLPMERITAKTEYSENSKYYDKLFRVFKKYNINIEKYLKFCLSELGYRSIRETVDMCPIRLFSSYLKENEQLRDVYNNFNSTANRIADICIERNISPAEYISELVVTNTLGYEYYAGNISRHYLAGIQNFKELYTKLDFMNREELSLIYEATDQLRDTLRKSFSRFGEFFVKPISYTSSIIKAKQENKNIHNNIKEENQICAN